MKTILRFAFALGSVVIALPAAAALNVFACEPEWGALAQELGGDKVSVYLATTALQDPHRIEARPSLIARIRSTDLLICSGSELEIGWIPLLLTQSGNTIVQLGSQVLRASQYVVKLKSRKSSTARSGISIPAAIRTSIPIRAISPGLRWRWRNAWY
jgi:zinc/manganese transport system substrate-binding protein